MGDLNYRLNTTFEELNNENIDTALKLVQNYDDQFFISKDEGNYPLYTEPKIEFLPTYKCDDNKKYTYVNKKN